MKHLTLLLACILALSLSASAQFTPQQYPFPYNPDSNQDGMVSMTDFLEILGVFGQEYPNSFFADSTKAVLDLGKMDATICLGLAESTYDEWRMVTTKDVFTSSHLICEATAGSANWISPGAYDQLNFWCWSEETDYATYGRIHRYPLTYGAYNPPPLHYHLQSDTTESYEVSLYRPFASNTISVQSTSRSCLLITEVQPTIEYMECLTPECIEDALNNGWQPLGGIGSGFGLWRENE